MVSRLVLPVGAGVGAYVYFTDEKSKAQVDETVAWAIEQKPSDLAYATAKVATHMATLVNNAHLISTLATSVMKFSSREGSRGQSSTDCTKKSMR